MAQGRQNFGEVAAVPDGAASPSAATKALENRAVARYARINPKVQITKTLYNACRAVRFPVRDESEQ